MAEWFIVFVILFVMGGLIIASKNELLRRDCMDKIYDYLTDADQYKYDSANEQRRKILGFLDEYARRTIIGRPTGKG